MDKNTDPKLAEIMDMCDIGIELTLKVQEGLKNGKKPADFIKEHEEMKGLFEKISEKYLDGRQMDLEKIIK